jgi:hypothetical protein
MTKKGNSEKNPNFTQREQGPQREELSSGTGTRDAA